MSMRRTYSCALITGAILLFTGGSLQAQQSGGGTYSGGSSTMGSDSGNTGDSTGSMKQGHESSGKMRQESSGRNSEPKSGSDATQKGSGRMPEPNKTPGPDSDGFEKSGLKPPPGSSGNTGSSGGMGSNR